MGVPPTSEREAGRSQSPAAAWDEMLEKAREASDLPYAPYSRLRVIAVLRDVAGRDHVGCNVENSSFGLTICAERAAVVRAVAEGARQWSRLLIYTPDSGPLAPCGACRQVLVEFVRDLPILSVGRDGQRREMNLRDLLPEPFAWPAGDEVGVGEHI